VTDRDALGRPLYGAAQPDGDYRRVTYVLDPALRVVAVLPFSPAVETDLASLKTVIDGIPAVGPRRLAASRAPVLVLPRIFEPKLCSALIGYYNRCYSAPTGGAVVFSCSLLHEATTVMKGRRYMFLPFLCDDAARRIREDNMPFLDGAMTGDAPQAARP
jgi:hypothetical protein